MLRPLAGPLVIFVGVACFALYFGSLPETVELPREETARALRSTMPMAAAADDIIADYEANEVGAEMKWKGTRRILTGAIRSIGADSAGNPYVILGPPSTTRRVQAVYSKKDNYRIAGLRKALLFEGDCEISGKMLTRIVARCR